MTDIVAAIDSGTQSTRAYLFDTAMQVRVWKETWRIDNVEHLVEHLLGNGSCSSFLTRGGSIRHLPNTHPFQSTACGFSPSQVHSETSTAG